MIAYLKSLILGSSETVASIVSNLQTTLTKLESHVATKLEEEAKHLEEAAKATGLAKAASDESAKAKAIAGNLKTLLVA